CRTFRTYEGGDHEIILGEVHAHHNTDMPPLAYGKGKFGEFSTS
ncbi:MAG: flavin reductase family protein, partial [Rhizobiales bacterium]|nr:flavin reductase family protein [Hyphomicrobiales bacterium]